MAGSPARGKKLFLIPSVKKIRRDLVKRKNVASALVTALRTGAVASKVPMKFRREAALTSANRVLKQLEEAIQLMDDSCGDNQLACPYVLDLSAPNPGKPRRGTRTKTS